MRIVADENVDRPIIDQLRAAGFEVVAIAEIGQGATDDLVLSQSVERSSLLLTADKDFGDLVFRQRLVSEGVVLLRLSGLSQELRTALVETAFRNHSDRFPGCFTVIEPGGIRIRQRVVPPLSPSPKR